MKKTSGSLAVMLCVFFMSLFLSSLGHAKTFKYELKDVYFSPGEVMYPNLDLNGIGSAELIVEQDSEQSQQELKQLKINFPNAPSITVREFKNMGNFFRAEVNNVWVYRKIVVDLNFSTPYLNPYLYSPDIGISATVSEKDLFVNDQNPYDPWLQGRTLFTGFGLLRDASPSVVIDNAAVDVDGKSLRLNLRTGYSGGPDAGSGPHFVIDSVWMGHGQATLHIPTGFGVETANFAEPIRMEVEEISGPNGPEYLITVVVKDSYGGEMMGSPIPLNFLLQQAYNTPF